MRDAKLTGELAAARHLLLLLQVQFARYGGELLEALRLGVPHAQAAHLYPYAYADLAPGLLCALRDPARGWGAQAVLRSGGKRQPEELYRSPIFAELERQENAWHDEGYSQHVKALLPDYCRWLPTQNEEAIKDELEGLLWDVFDAVNFLQWVEHMRPDSRAHYLNNVARTCVELGVRLPAELACLCSVAPQGETQAESRSGAPLEKASA